MGFELSNEEFNQVLDKLKEDYLIYAPKRLAKRGRFSDTDVIRYGEISRVEEIEWKEKADFSPKEIIFPITQTLFYFNEEVYKEPDVSAKRIIIFLRPCDINGIRRLDSIFLQNGNTRDFYYERLRNKVKYVMIECKESYESCFCVSMNANYTADYAMAVRFLDNNLLLAIKDDEFKSLIDKAENIEFKPEYVQENIVLVNVPDTEKIQQEIFKHEMWEEYSERCIACGRCNMVCITCSCFTTRDVSYKENEKAGERRRTWAGCHIDGFTNMAGGHGFRKQNGERMRFKTMHKIYDYKKRFGEHMCVGCGRCDDVCPEYISFSNCINKLEKITHSRGQADES